MKFLPAAVVTVLGSMLINGSSLAKSYSLESFGCLFQLSQQLTQPLRPDRVIRFSFSPLTERLALQSLTPVFASTESSAPVEVEQTSSRTEFSAGYISAPRLTNSAGLEPWPVYDLLRRWQDNPNVKGLSHTFNPNSYIALDYSDVFDRGRTPERGSQGPSVMFRHNF